MDAPVFDAALMASVISRLRGALLLWAAHE